MIFLPNTVDCVSVNSVLLVVDCVFEDCSFVDCVYVVSVFIESVCVECVFVECVFVVSATVVTKEGHSVGNIYRIKLTIWVFTGYWNRAI